MKRGNDWIGHIILKKKFFSISKSIRYLHFWVMRLDDFHWFSIANLAKQLTTALLEATYFNVFILLFTLGILPDWTAPRTRKLWNCSWPGLSSRTFFCIKKEHLIHPEGALGPCKLASFPPSFRVEISTIIHRFRSMNLWSTWWVLSIGSSYIRRSS